MSIIDSKEWASWPICSFLEFWLDNIKDDRYSVFIIVPNYPLMGIRCIRCYHTVSFARKLCWLIGLHKLEDWRIQFLWYLWWIAKSSSTKHQVVVKWSLHCRLGVMMVLIILLFDMWIWGKPTGDVMIRALCTHVVTRWPVVLLRLLLLTSWS